MSHLTQSPALELPGTPWNKGRLIGQRRPLTPEEVWSIRVRLELGGPMRDLALFNLAIDSKLRGCDLVALKVEDVFAGGQTRDRTTIVQRKTGRPVHFEITENSKRALTAWIDSREIRLGDYLFPSRCRDSQHLSTRQYARVVQRWAKSIGLDAGFYGSYSLRRTKAAQINRKTGNLRAVQLLLGQTKLESTVYLGIDVEDALSISEKIEL